MGNRILEERKDPGGKVVESNHFVYNGGNQMAEAILCDGRATRKVCYTYDGDGNRVYQVSYNPEKDEDFSCYYRTCNYDGTGIQLKAAGEVSPTEEGFIKLISPAGQASGVGIVAMPATMAVVVKGVVIAVDGAAGTAYAIEMFDEDFGRYWESRAEEAGSERGIKEEVGTPNVKYPGEDPTVPPGEGWEWRGPADKGSWYRPETGETLHPDLSHPAPGGPHWDYIPYKNGPQYRVYPDGTVVPEK